MKTTLLNHFSECNIPELKPCIMALGFFDGVHLGHRRLIEKAKWIAKKKGLELTILTFFPHPKEVLNQVKFNYLISLERKVEIFEQMGVDRLFIVRFDKSFAQLEPEEFVQNYLIPLKAKEIVAGFDFTYGHKGLGTIHSLETHGKGAFRVTMVSKVEQFGKKISSTLIRSLLGTGQVDQIREYLGYDYYTKGKIYRVLPQSGFTRVQFEAAAYHSMPVEGSYDVVVSFDYHVFHSICHVRKGKNGEGFAEVEIPNYITKVTDVKDLKIEVKWINKADHDQGDGSAGFFTTILANHI